MANVTVIGVGYVGLVTGTCFADLGNKVVALDIIEKKIENLRNGILPIYEPGLKEVVERNIRTERLTFSTNYKTALKDAEFVFICVGTPEGVDGEADLKYVRMAAEAIAENMDHELIVINKSTVPVGTGDWVTGIIREKQPTPIPFSVVSCPEFLREGSALRDFFNPDRTVLGSSDKAAAHRVAQLHLPLRAPIIVTDIRTAEMIKYASNAFLATRISFINEIANICEALGADVKEVAQGMGYDKRIGHHFLEPGVGYGGSCFEGDETVFVIESGQVVARSLGNLFAEAENAYEGDTVEVATVTGKRVLAFDLLTGCPTVADVQTLTRRPFDGTMVTIKTSMGRAIRVTADHPIVLHKSYGFDVVPAFEVQSGDHVPALTQLPTLEAVAAEAVHATALPALFNQTAFEGTETMRIEIVEVIHTQEQLEVYSLETTTGTFIGAEGEVCHNCFPKDVKALAYMGQVHGTEPQLLQSVMEINQTQRKQIVLKLEDMLGTLKGKAIALLGLAFKENTDDIRESPSLDIAAMLHERGAVVRGYDPVATENVQRGYAYIQLAEDPYELARGADALVVATPWNEFKSLDLDRVKGLMKQPNIVDGRNLYDPERIKRMGFNYRGVGRGFRGAMDLVRDEK
jgi:nucleotide sugar dehydrogenase